MRRKMLAGLQNHLGLIVTILLIVSIADVLFLSTIMLVENPIVFHHASDKTVVQPQQPVLHFWDRLELITPALIILVALMLLIPGVWIYNFSRELEYLKERDKKARQDFLAWLTVAGVPFLVLGFAMIMEFHKVMERQGDAAGALAAIMVLYALTVLANFLFVEVREVQKTFEKMAKDVTDASDALKLQVQLGEALEGESAPAAPMIKLLKAWHQIYTWAPAVPNQANQIRRNLMGTLLSTYAQEESANAEGILEASRIPKTVRVFEDGEPTDSHQDWMYIATSVGYYLTFLREAVRRLSITLRDGSVVSLATVTYTLPPYWWNWPETKKDHRSYRPIASFRDRLRELAGDANTTPWCRVFRKVIVSKGDSNWVSDSLALEKDWEMMRSWRILLTQDAADREWKPVSSHAYALPREYDDVLIKYLDWTEHQKGHDAIWVVTKAPAQGDPVGYKTMNLFEYYEQIMHPRRDGSCQGYTKILPIDQTTFEQPFFDRDHDPAKQGLNGCSEITFLGTSRAECRDAWQDGATWGLALLTTMSPGTETMFVVAIWGDLMERLWKSVQCTVNRTQARELASGA